MKLPRTAITLAAVISVIGAGLALSTCHESVRHVPKVVDRPTLDSLINVHGSERRELQVCGRTFRDISHAGRGYVSISNSDLILFVCGTDLRPKRLVIVNTNDCDIIEILLDDVWFDGNFRSKPDPSQRIADYVEDYRSNQVFLVSKNFEYFERSVVDLTRGTIRVIERDQFDKQIDLSPWIYPTNVTKDRPSPTR